jgi:hypothetical protein
VNDALDNRFSMLVEEGLALYAEGDGDGAAWFRGVDAPHARAWMLSAVNLIEYAAPATSRYVGQARHLLPGPADPVMVENLGALSGILKSAASEWRNGMLEPLEHRFAGPTLESFLRSASLLMAESPPQIPPAAVLTSAVFEDAVRRLCLKHDLGCENASIEPRLDILKSHQVISKLQNKRLKGFAGVRDAAFHADWNALTASDVNQLIEAVEELLELHFGGAAQTATQPEVSSARG